MSLPPERISIKRRRQDEPIETLILESELKPEKRRRFTEFFFKRLRRHDDIGSSEKPSNQILAQKTTPVRWNNSVVGIPVVRATAPGDEIRDYVKYKAEQERILKATELEAASSLPPEGEHVELTQEPSTAHRRRFHLMRDLSSTLSPNSPARLRRSKLSLRPPVATFMEHQAIQPEALPSIYTEPPIDNIIELENESDVKEGNLHVEQDSVRKRTKVDPFLKSSTSTTTKNGQSIRDDPMTWDHDSDQLANELATLAFDIDPVDASEPPTVAIPPKHEMVQDDTLDEGNEESMVMDVGDEFVFETYIRVKHDPQEELLRSGKHSEIGILVIDDENEDLWAKYVQGDGDDDDWDEEDEDSNAEDNPRNDYPDDEVSSDDEYGRNVYKYRQNASDDEDHYQPGGHW